MRHAALLLFFALFMAKSSAQTGEPSAQQILDQVRLQQMQNEADLARMRSDVELWRLERERRRAEAAQDQLREQIEQRDADTAVAVKKAEDAADYMREEMQLAAVKSADAAYVLAVIGLPMLIGIFIAKKATKEGGMKYEQKFGVVVMVCTLLLSLFALTISDGWNPRFDALQNLMSWLRIRLFPEYEGAYAPSMIDLPTKYVLTALAALFGYGFMTYLGIAPAWRRPPKAQQGQVTPTEP